MMRLAGFLLLAALLAGVGFGTRVAYAPDPGDAAALRLAWRALGEAALHCRTPSAAEQAGLPAHMRRKQICERRLPSFQLRVVVDGAVALDERVDPAGASGDRAAVVLRELRVAPGSRHVQIAFTPLADAPPGAARGFDQIVRLAPAAVALVMEDPESRALVARTAPEAN